MKTSGLTNLWQYFVFFFILAMVSIILGIASLGTGQLVSQIVIAQYHPATFLAMFIDQSFYTLAATLSATIAALGSAVVGISTFFDKIPLDSPFTEF